MTHEIQLSSIYQSARIDRGLTAPDLAQKINAFVREKIRIIPNYLSQSPDWSRERDQFLEDHPEVITAAQEQEIPVDLFVQKAFEKMLEIATYSQACQNDRPLTIADIAIAANEYRSANCVGMSALGFYYPHVGHQVEMFSIRSKNDHWNRPHTFLVIDRDQQVNPQDYSLWGDKAVICDPWMNTAFQASEIPHKLYKFTRQNYDEISKQWITHVDPFDSLRDELVIYNPAI